MSSSVPSPVPGTRETESADRVALFADLQALDERLEQAIGRLRQGQAAEADPTVRGLLIAEDDVDGWLAALPGGVEDAAGARSAGALRFPAQAGGRLARLGALFGLGAFERAVLLTALAPEIDLAYTNLYAYIQDDVTRKHATVDLVLMLWCGSRAERLEAREYLGADGALRRHLLLAVDDGASPTPFLARPLLLDPRVAAYLLGSDRPDPALVPVLTRVTPDSHAWPPDLAPLPADQLARLARAAGDTLADPPRLRPVDAPAPPRGLVVWMRGPETQGKRDAAEQLAAELGRPLLVVDCPALAALGGDLARLLTRILREARLGGALLFWAGADALAPRREEGTPDLAPDLARLLRAWPGCALFDLKTTPPPMLTGGQHVVYLDFPAPSNARRLLLWQQALSGGVPLAADVDLDLLSGAFRLTGDQIAAAAESAGQAAAWHMESTDAAGAPHIAMRDLLVAARNHSSQGLGMLARKIIPRYTWADLVLPPDRLAQLYEVCSGVRFGPVVFEEWGFDRKLSAGKGVNVLFAGQPGTGKTMAAEVLAIDLGLDLYKIDLSSIVSKYIGETEKNLEKIFREGRSSNAILFFDEADSIFGKRSEVKDSHDRYANIEISYLLQRMEEYDGIVILATNLRKNLDEAFIRRLRGAIEFPMPEEPDRLEIWRRTFPPEAPLAPDADLAFLARQFKLSGGNIKNIVLEAAFLAAAAGTTIGMTQLVHATRREHQKIGRLIAPTDFGPYAHLARRIEHQDGR